MYLAPAQEYQGRTGPYARDDQPVYPQESL
jgi:hypothetical protein